MKFLFALVLIALAGGAGWMAYPEIHAKLEAKLAAARNAAQEKEEPEKPEPPAPASPTKSMAAEMLASMKNQGSAAPSSSPSGETAMAPAPGESKTDDQAAGPARPADPVEERYPLPEFRSIEDITREWTVIPARAFPRTVKTKTSVSLEGPSGKAVLPANSSALAVGMAHGMLIVMRDRNDPARGMVPLANTDLKETLTNLYEKYKDYKIKQVMNQRERARRLLATANGATPEQMALAGPKPTVLPGGVIKAMMESLEAKEITETTADKITSWGGLNVEEIDGAHWWTGTIQCTVDNAIFGPVPTELMALIKNDKVVKWIYSGSKEPVQ